jgi:hypothetical protein
MDEGRPHLSQPGALEERGKQEALVGERCEEQCQAGHCGWGDAVCLLCPGIWVKILQEASRKEGHDHNSTAARDCSFLPWWLPPAHRPVSFQLAVPKAPELLVSRRHSVCL